jgi:hypothetical protein
MPIQFAVGVSLLLASMAVAQDGTGTAGAPPVSVTTRVLQLRDLPFPAKPSKSMSAAMSRDGGHLVVSYCSGVWPSIETLEPDHPSTYLYDCKTGTSRELRPVFNGTPWRLVGKSAISPDGRFVAAACVSETGKMAADKRDHCSTMALVDTMGDESRLIDLSALGIHAPIPTTAPALSRDATFLAIPTTPDFGNQIDHGWTMLWSGESGRVRPVTLDDHYYGTYNPSISDDGRFLAIDSFSKDPNTYPNGAFLIDLQSSVLDEIPGWLNGHWALGGTGYSISGDGKRVAFIGTAPPDAVDAHPGSSAVFLYDQASGSTTLLSSGPGDASSNVDIGACSLSGSGEYVAFVKSANPMAVEKDIVPGVYARELASGRLARVNGERVAGRFEYGFDEPGISDNGRRVVFIRRVMRRMVHEVSEESEVVLADVEW